MLLDIVTDSRELLDNAEPTMLVTLFNLDSSHVFKVKDTWNFVYKQAFEEKG